MKKIIGIYIITSPSGSIYIGQSINIYGRWNDYVNLTNCKSQTRLYNSFLKYGVENHTFEIIDTLDVDDEHELDWLEIYFIKHFDTFETRHGLNLTEGGSYGRPSAETRKKLSESHKGQKAWNKDLKASDEAIKKNRESHLGKPSGNKNKKASKETRKKMSESKKGKPTWNKGVKGQVAWNKGIPMSEEQKLKMSGENSPLFGKNQTEEHVKKRSKSMMGKNKGKKYMTKKRKNTQNNG